MVTELNASVKKSVRVDGEEKGAWGSCEENELSSKKPWISVALTDEGMKLARFPGM